MMVTTPNFTTPPPLSAAAPPSTHSSQVDKLALLIDKSKSKYHLLQIHATLIRRGFHDHTILNFKLQRRYSAVGHLHYSVTLFNQTRNPDVFTWSSIIHAHTQSNLNDQALSYYIQMLTNHVQPNAFTFSSLLNGITLQPTKAVHCHVVKFGLCSDTYVATGLVDGYARGGDFVSSEKLFDEMPEKSLVSYTTMLTCYAKHGKLCEARMLFDEMEGNKDVVVWNVMIDGYAQNGFPNECLLLFRRMLVEKVRPDVITLLAVLSSCGQVGALESGRWVHSYVKNEKNGGVGVEVRVGTALVDMYCKCGSLEDARKVFDKIDGKDVVAWNSMIMGYAVNGFSEEALKLFYEMCSVGVKPSYVTFIALLTACGHSGLVAKGWEVFNMMKNEYEMEPRVEHFGCMVSLLGRAGRLQEAYDLVRSMKIEPDPMIWGALLWACRLHNNISLGEEIAEFLLSNDLASSGTYVLLSNIYAASGNWVGAAKVRALMKDSGVEKEPGCSTIEVNNRIHEFIAGDLKHSKSKDIYLMLEEMNSWLKGNGYTPKTDIVLHDIGKEQKELSLEVHSEKLALAFGLISTRPGTTIKIVKNLRVCLDCHDVMNMISRITGRRIVMRDRNRFHHFDNGSCSCGDYW
ncbi:pentatricopeptide repeat-containing protein chloroplastic-like [Trifolium pratense]|uniref:Pentatricopeptide repeat-containing protein chloroplastic-like n=1 Tax=Trifolium pratense TaxID=57577 RepID=A0A2K3NVH4_TRIPR|nr:pentatricopeptide repeat-containing protein chloroplastic-like [Trifolium pratense]